MKKILAIGASGSRKSINQTLANHAASQVADSEMIVVELSDYMLPLFSVDVEAQIGIPEDAHRFNRLIESADGLVISLAEHNGSYTAVFKNLLDWLTRIDMKVWKGKPILLMATSPGGRGGANVLSAAELQFPFIGGDVVAVFSLPAFYESFLNDEITDVELASKLKEQIALFEQAMEKKEAVLST